MQLQGRIIAESPIYRGNMRKTLFTRDGDGTHRLVSLAGQIEGTAQALMDAFIGRSRDGRNKGLLERLWERLYNEPMPEGLIRQVTCTLQEAFYPQRRFFDLRMGLRLDDDRWAAEANANYRMETVLRCSVFDFNMRVDDRILAARDNQARLYYLLEEMRAGRFWFGAGKTRGLGRLRLEMEIPFGPGDEPPPVNPQANHLTLQMAFDTSNPLLVRWNWGRILPDTPAFPAVEGQVLVEAMRDLPDPIRERLRMLLSGPILSPEDWKQRLAQQLPRVLAIWLREQSRAETESWILPGEALDKLGKGKRHALSAKVIQAARTVADRPFPSQEALDEALREALGRKANMAKRIIAVAEQSRESGFRLNPEAWQTLVRSLHLDPGLEAEVAQALEDEQALTEVLARACAPVLPRLYQQVDQQIRLLQSDTWVDEEIAERQQHLRIKTMLLEGQITEAQWGDPRQVPDGVSPQVWRDFLDKHRRVRYRHMVKPRNLRKSIVNDRNFIEFLRTYRDRVRQELAQPYNVDFRMDGPSGREVSRKYGKPYDMVFTRMLSWAPSQDREGWEIYVPGSTLKGAFRKRATQILRTLWGEGGKTTQVIQRLFGQEGQRGLVLFSDAYLMDPIDHRRAWCSMDAVKMDPRTGRPVEAAKRDILYACGKHLRFEFRLDLQDVSEDDLEALAVLAYLLEDFRRGDVPLGGMKTDGLGWVQGQIEHLEWLAGHPEGVGATLFAAHTPTREGLWYRLSLDTDQAVQALAAFPPLVAPDARPALQTVPTTTTGFVSHRAFGGHCGRLVVEAEVLTPIHIQESGEPSYVAQMDDGPVNGWDFFSIAPPEAAQRPADRVYAIPSLSLRGLLRHIYSIASDARQPSTDLSRLNPVDHLFGWVGQGPNQALMGRLVFGFAPFQDPELAWFKVPYPYGQWKYDPDAGWQRQPGSGAQAVVVADTWRLFPHAPLAPIVERLDDFTPDTAQANYVRAILPGSRARFTLRFWNLDDETLQRLIWCLVLEPGMAHKMGKHRYLGFGSLRFRLLPESYRIDWARRYGGAPADEWQIPLQAEEWINPGVIAHLDELRRILHVGHL